MGYPSEEQVLYLIGLGKMDAETVVDLYRESHGLKTEETGEVVPRPASGFFERLRLSGRGKVLVGGQDDVMVRYGKCCTPIPGERIVGFVTRGRGITVHGASCKYVQAMEEDRLVEVDWDRGEGAMRDVTIKVTSLDTPGLLTRMSQVFSSLGVNIRQAIVRTTDQKAENVFQVQIKNISQLKTILRALQRIEGVTRVERIQGK